MSETIRAQAKDSIQDQGRPTEERKLQQGDNKQQFSSDQKQEQKPGQGKENSSEQKSEQKQEQGKDNSSEQKSGQEQGKEKEQSSGPISWLADAVKDTVTTLLNPITTSVLGVDLKEGDQQKNQGEQKEDQKDQKQQQNDEGDKTQQKDQKDQKQTQEKTENQEQKKTEGKKESSEQQKQEQEQPQQQEQKQEQQKQQPKKKTEPLRLKELSEIGQGRNVQLVFGGRCLAFNKKEIIVEEVAPSQSEQNTFFLTILKEEESLVRIKGGELYLTADRNIGVLMAEEDSGKQNSFHLEKVNGQFTLRVHNQNKWLGVGPKLEKKDIVAKEQHGTEVEVDGQPYIEKIKCFQFEDHSTSRPLEIYLL